MRLPRPILALSLLAMTVSGASSQSLAPGESGNQVPPARFLSVVDNQGPREAERLTLGMWVSAGNVTTYTIGNSWNDWVLWLVYDKLREPSPYVGVAEDWLATSIEQVSDDARVLRLADEPGALANVAGSLKDAGVNIESMHILSRQAGYAMVALKTDNRAEAVAAIGIEVIV